MDDQNLNEETNNNLQLENQSKILEELNTLKKEFQSKIKYDEQKEKTITKLHDELQVYKRDLYKKMLLPIINDLIHFTNRSEKDLDFLKDAPADKLLERLHYFLDDVRDVLDRQGVEAFKLESDEFDPKKQKILKTIETDDPSLDKKIANHRLFGYEWEDKIVKHEGVDIYVYTPQEAIGADMESTHTKIAKETETVGGDSISTLTETVGEDLVSSIKEEE